MNIVFFVESYHHNAMMNGICVEKVVNALVKKGHQVTVFTSSKHVYDIPKSENINGAQVYAIKRDLDTLIRLYCAHDKKRHRLLKFFHKFYAMFVHVVMSRSWPMRSIFTPYRYFRLARRKLKNVDVDVILGTYFHIEEVLAAIKLKKIYPNADLITYTLDAMSGRETPLIFKKAKYARKSICRWEQFVYSKSDKICVMESHRSHYENGNYSEEILSKLRYVEVPMLVLDDNLPTVRKEPIHEKINITYTGYTSVQTGSAQYFIELMKSIPDAEGHFYGSMDEEVKNTFNYSGLKDTRLFFHGQVEHELVIEKQYEADFLVTFGSINSCMISGKIFDYMARRKPIICFYKIDEDQNVQYLKKYPNVLIIKEQDNSYEKDVELIEKFIHRTDFIEVDAAFLSKTFYKSTPEAMVDVIVNRQE